MRDFSRPPLASINTATVRGAVGARPHRRRMRRRGIRAISPWRDQVAPSG
jgi:hypothetical protein